MSALLTLGEADAELVLAPETGGAIATFRWRGEPVLRPTPPGVVAAREVNGHACYPLVPYSNRIACGRLTFGGRTHQLDRNFGDHPHSIHGVGWQRSWTVLEHDASSALLAYEHRPAGAGAASGRGAADARAWPWPFRATQWFQLARAADGNDVQLRIRLAISNTGERAFPFGLGWHPYFARDAATALGFDAAGVWETDATVMPTRHVAAAGDYRFDPSRPIGDTALDNVYTGWRGEAHLDDVNPRLSTVLRGDTSCPFLVVYVPRNGDTLALEPVTHMTDAFNRAERGERDTGTRVLGPGEGYSSTMEISVRAL